MKNADLFECHGGWGHPPYPLLPNVVRRKIGSHRVEQIILKSEALPIDTNYSDFDQSIWRKLHSIKDTTAKSLRSIFREEFDTIENEIVFDLNRFDHKLIRRLPLSRRARNVLEKEYHALSKLAAIHYRDLIKLPNLGINTVLEIACVMEYLNNSLENSPRQKLLDLFADTHTDSKLSQINPIENLTLKLEDAPDLSRDLIEVLRCFVSPHQVEKIGLRYGWLGDEPKTLDEVGQKYGVTRERIRQIEAKFERKLPANKIRIRSLDKCISLFKNATILTNDDAYRLIYEKGLTTKPISIEGIVKYAAVLLAKDNELEIATVNGCKYVGKKGASRIIDLIRQEANVELSKYGCGNIDELIEEIFAKSSVDLPKDFLSKDFVVKVLKGFGNVIFLDKASNWFWYETKRNRLINGLRKIFSVTDKLEVNQIREGLQRSYNQRSLRLVPSKEAILGVCKLLPNFYVNDTLVGVHKKYNQNEELNGIEKAFLKVISESEYGLLTRNDLLDRLQGIGISDVSGSGYLSWSPIIEQVAVNLWGIKGGNIDPIKVIHLKEINMFKPKVSIKTDWGWTPERSFYIIYRLTKSSVRNGVFPLVTGITEFLTNKTYPLIDVQEKKVGDMTIREDGSSFWGVGSYLKRVGAEEDDYLVLDIDLHQNIANIKTGGYELVSKYV